MRAPAARWVCALALVACARRESPPPVAGVPTGGAALLARFECHRCHDGTGLAEAPHDQHCVRCHQDLLAGRFVSPSFALARWQAPGKIVSLRVVPSLASVGRRLRRDWVAGYLLAPRDLRPAMVATMPRLAMTPAEAQAIAAHLVPLEAPPARFGADEVPAGAAIYRRLRCGECHRYTGSPVDELGPAPESYGELAARPPSPDAVALAPDLVMVRERFQSGALVDWLLDPGRRSPETVMPKYPLAPGEARALAAFLMLAPLGPPVERARPARLPLLARPVGFEELSARVLRRTCWHCHAPRDQARGDGGPGNIGGLGFPARGLDLSSEAAVLAGAIGEDGRRRSILAPLGDGTPRVVAHLLARREEARGTAPPELRGMPLGLPPLSSEDIQLVESWIAQRR